MNSCLYEGWVRHRRLVPAPHAFRYRLYMTYLDLAEIEGLFRDRWFWSTRRLAPVAFRRADYLGDSSLTLDEAVRCCIEERTGVRPAGAIRVLTHLAHFGYCFNPVSFYYCFDATGSRIENILTEITNTPWGERHQYVLGSSAADTATAVRKRFTKAFHVSPFLPMELTYDWRFNEPGETLAAHMDVMDPQRKVFDATLLMQRRPITGANLARMLARFPLMTARASLAIYWQALRLYLKRTPFHAHPRRHLNP